MVREREGGGKGHPRKRHVDMAKEIGMKYDIYVLLVNVYHRHLPQKRETE